MTRQIWRLFDCSLEIADESEAHQAVHAAIPVQARRALDHLLETQDASGAHQDLC